MCDLRFDSSLTLEQIEKNFEDVDLFSGVMEGLEEALSFEKAMQTEQNHKNVSIKLDRI